MTESDDDIICVDGPEKGELKDDEIQQYIELFVDDEIENGREVAVKQMILEKQRSKQLTLNEICALKHLKSEKIIPLYGVYYSHCDLEGKTLFM